MAGAVVLGLKSRPVRPAPSTRPGAPAAGPPVPGRQRPHRAAADRLAADPVLRSADLARLLVSTADAAHQDTTGIAQQADAERQPVRIGELDASVCERIHVVADLLDIFESLGTIGCLKRDDIRERGLRPFDLRRDDRLLADKAVEEPIGAPAPSFRLPQGGRERPQHRREAPQSILRAIRRVARSRSWVLALGL